MFQYPLQKALPVALACGYPQDTIDQFLLFIVQFDAVDCEENQHGVCADPFVAIHKRMIADKPKP